MAAARRGRPPRPAREVVDGSDPLDPLNPLKLRGRVAWLLRVNRLYGAGAAWANAASFAAAFAGGSHPAAVSQSKISRWETGQVAVPYRAIRRYEELLCLPARSLTSTVDVVSRYLSPHGGADLAVPPGLPAAGIDPGGSQGLDALLDRACSTSVMTAADWDDLGVAVASAPGLRLRRRDWEELTGRLLVETVSADGDAWKARFGAFIRLLRHPDGQQAAIAACASWARGRENYGMVEVISLLDMCRHPDASAVVLGQLVDPVNDDAFAGALLTCVRKVGEGHFSPAQLGRIARVGLDVLTAGADDQLRAHATAVLHRLPPSGHARGSLRLDAPARHREDQLSDLIAARSGSLLAREAGHFDDEVLPVLIKEAISCPVIDARLYAAFLIRDSPYRGPVADSLTWAMERAGGSREHGHLTRLLGALRIIGGQPHRQAVENFTRPGLPFPVRDAAVRALAHMGGDSGTEFWRQLVDRYAVTPAADGNGLLPAPARGGARWWLNLPAHMFISAGR